MRSGTVVMPAPAAVRWVTGLVAEAWYRLMRWLVRVACAVLWRVRVEGREHEPAHAPFIAAGNHTSAVDPPIVGSALRHRAFYMAKDDLLAVPVLGLLLRSVGVFPVRRGQPDRRAIRRSLDILESRGVLVMFPEGTRSVDGRLQHAEPGAAMIALRAGVPVLPAAVINGHRALPKGARWPRRVQVTVRMGPPISVPRVEGRLDHATLAAWGERIMAAIEALLPPDQKRTAGSGESGVGSRPQNSEP